MERLVDKSHIRVSIKQLAHAAANLFIIVGSKSLHHNTHRPDCLLADVRAADALPCRSAPEVRIVGAPDKVPGVPVHRVRCHLRIQISQRQQTGHIGIVHNILVAEAVHLEGVNRPVNRMVIDCMGLQGCRHFIGQGTASRGKIRPVIHSRQNLRSLA